MTRPHFIIVSLLIFLSACASPEKRAQRKAALDNMPGLTTAKLYDIYGLPEKVTNLPDGGALNIWSHSRSEVYEPEQPREKPKVKTVGGKIGNSIVESMLGINHPGDIIEHKCTLEVTTHSDIVSEAKTDGEFLDSTCDYFLDKWYDYQDSQHPQKH